MARENAVVDVILELTPTPRIAAAETVPPGSQHLTVAFSSGRIGVLDVSAPRGRVWAEVLQSLHATGQPAYVEIEPQSGLITELLQPVRYDVGRLLGDDKRGFEVELVISQARHYLARSHPRFLELRTMLEQAREHSRPLYVTESDDHQIIDVRPAPGEGRPRLRTRASR
jgi:hypothetical protein